MSVEADMPRSPMDQKRIADLEHELARWKKAIEGLTPSGSEFVNDPEACAAHIRDRYNPLHTFKELRAEIARLTAENKALTDEYHSIREAAHEGLSEEQNRAHARTIEKIQFVREQRDALKIECEGLKIAMQQCRLLLDGVGHNNESDALLAEQIDKVLREALDAARKGGK
jgi:regulator of replication initiation timing